MGTLCRLKSSASFSAEVVRAELKRHNSEMCCFAWWGSHCLTFLFAAACARRLDGWLYLIPRQSITSQGFGWSEIGNFFLVIYFSYIPVFGLGSSLLPWLWPESCFRHGFGVPSSSAFWGLHFFYIVVSNSAFDSSYRCFPYSPGDREREQFSLGSKGNITAYIVKRGGA